MPQWLLRGTFLWVLVTMGGCTWTSAYRPGTTEDLLTPPSSPSPPDDTWVAVSSFVADSWRFSSQVLPTYAPNTTIVEETATFQPAHIEAEVLKELASCGHHGVLKHGDERAEFIVSGRVYEPVREPYYSFIPTFPLAVAQAATFCLLPMYYSRPYTVQIAIEVRDRADDVIVRRSEVLDLYFRATCVYSIMMYDLGATGLGRAAASLASDALREAIRIARDRGDMTKSADVAPPHSTTMN